MASVLQEMIEQFGLPEKPRTEVIPRASVLDWMHSDDIEVLGALYAFLMKADYARRVQPSLSFSDYSVFLRDYFERCFLENPDGDWTHSRYAAAWDLASWFGATWRDPHVDRQELATIKNWLAKIYKGGDDAIKRCVVDGTLEHLFEDRDIVRFFSDWKKDPKLAIAYGEALEWSAKGGRTGLARDETE